MNVDVNVCNVLIVNQMYSIRQPKKSLNQWPFKKPCLQNKTVGWAIRGKWKSLRIWLLIYRLF